MHKGKRSTNSGQAIYLGVPTTTRQLIRNRNIMCGLPIKFLREATIPWGYEQNPNDPVWLIPIERNLRLLLKAKQLRKRSSYIALASWLSTETGQYITRSSLHKIMNTRPPLNVLKLPLHERFQVATSETEEKAIELCPESRCHTDKNRENKEEYKKRRIKTAARARETKQTLDSLLSGQRKCPCCHRGGYEAPEQQGHEEDRL